MFFYALTCIKDKYTPKSILRFFSSYAYAHTQLVSDKHTSNNHFGKNHHQNIEKMVAKSGRCKNRLKLSEKILDEYFIAEKDKMLKTSKNKRS